MKNMKKSAMAFVSGSLVTAMVMTSSFAFAETKQKIDAIFGRVSLVVDDKKVENETLLYNGTTYLPVRAISEALGKEVYYDEKTQTAYVKEKATNTAPSHDPSHAWSYKGETGPSHWGDLSPEYSLAKNGKEQSPINIKTDTVKTSKSSSNVDLHYLPTSFKVENNGHTIEGVPQSKDSYITVDGEKYYFAQLHFHAPSEHQIDEKNSAMEVHFVNKTTDGKIAVIGLLINSGEENKELKEFFSKMPTKVTSEETMVTLDSKIDISKIIPTDKSVYRYSGSLTTPPATEKVKWIVYKKPITLSKEQLEAYTSIYSGTNRPVQPLNDREVTLY